MHEYTGTNCPRTTAFPSDARFNPYAKHICAKQTHAASRIITVDVHSAFLFFTLFNSRIVSPRTRANK